MIVSMTGFGRCRRVSDDFTVTVEVKTVNQRFREFHFRMPRELLRIEDKIKKKIGEYVNRGRIDVFITIEGEGFLKSRVEVDWSLMEEYYRTLFEIREKYHLQNAITLQDLISREELISIREKEDDNEEFEKLIIEAAEEAAKQLKEMRLTEGIALRKDLEVHLGELKEKVTNIRDLAPQLVQNYAERLRNRMEEFANGQIDEVRIVNEVAIFADKADISEELARLESHIRQFSNNLDTTEPVGRKLDFLIQEMNREVNTIGSKGNDASIAGLVVQMKSLLEKMREQVQNIE